MASNIYLKIYPTGKATDYFKGNSQDKNHITQIELDSWGGSFEQPIAAATKSSELGPSSRCNHAEFKFTKFYDNSTDDLIKACWIGQCLDAVVCLYRPLDAGGGKADQDLTNVANRYLQITLQKCYIKAISISGGADDVAKEDIALVYNYVQYAFTEIDLQTGKLKTSGHPAIDWWWTTNATTGADGKF